MQAQRRHASGMTPSEASDGSRKSQGKLSGARLSRSEFVLIGGGAVGGILFALTYLIEGATRPGYDATQQAISALSLGPGGVVQQINFVAFGVLLLFSAVGWRRVLRPGRARVLFPLFEALTGVGLIVDGFFSQDPAPGYPVGAVLLTTPTLHGKVHVIFAIIAITSLALGCFALAWRFSVEPQWHGWALYSVVVGLLTIIFIAIFGAAQGAHGPAGVFERLATGVHSVWSLTVLAKLLIQARQRSTPSAN